MRSAYAPARERSCSTTTTARPARARAGRRASRLPGGAGRAPRSARRGTRCSVRCASTRASDDARALAARQRREAPRRPGGRRRRCESPRRRRCSSSSNCGRAHPRVAAHGDDLATRKGKLTSLDWFSTARRRASSPCGSCRGACRRVARCRVVVVEFAARAPSSVDLPAPLGPTSARTSPRRTSTLTSCRICRPSRRTPTPRASSTTRLSAGGRGWTR